MAISDDFSIAANGDIRYTGTTTNYTVIAFHRWLGDLMDDAQASGNDLLDITDATASARSTDNIIALNAPFNIDDVAAQHLYDGSITQDNGNTIYDGILVFAPQGTPLQLIQNGAPVSPNFWDTGLNADAAAGISHRFMVKVRSGGADIDGRRLLGQTRDFGFSYSEFPTTTVRGNNVLALTYASDLNNETAEATIRGYTGITNSNEGYTLLDVNNDTVNEPYYSEWNTNQPTNSMNDFYERHKWLHRESTIEDSNADTGSDFQVGNATITGQAQSFQNGVNAQLVTRVRVRLKKTGSPTGNLVCKIEDHSGTYGTSSIPGGTTHATSGNLDVTTLTTAYKEYEFAFPTPFLLVASTNYTVTFEMPVVDGSNYVQIDGQTTGTHSGNRSQEVSSTWTPTAADDLWFEVYASPQQYGLPGEVFRGVTHEIPVDNPSGTLVEPELMTWTEATVASSGQLLATDSTTAATKVWIQLLTGIVPTDGTVLTGNGGGTVQVNGSATARTVSAPSVGASTGTFIVGAYGLGIEVLDLNAGDKLTDLDGTLRNPPNNVTFSLGGMIVAKDRALVAPLGYTFAFDNEGGTPPFQVGETLTFTAPAGTAYLSYLLDNVPDTSSGRMNVRMLSGDPPQNNSTISGGTSGATADVNGAVAPSEDQRQLKLNTTLSAANETALVCTDTIPTDTPSATGLTTYVRVELNSGIFRLVPYDSYTSATFTLGTADTGAGGIQLNVTAASGTFARLSGSFITDGFFPGMRVTTTNFTTGGNNTTKTIATLAADGLSYTVTDNTGLGDETGSGDERSQSIGHDFSGDNATGGAGEAGNSVFLGYIDKLAASATESFTGVFVASRNLFIRVRDGIDDADGPIKTFETTGVLSSSGGSTTAIRTSDE